MPENVLCISPHPDDEAIGCGGALRLHANRGDTVRVVFLTSGEGGMRDLHPEETHRIREAEAGRAAEVLGVGDTEFWRLPDGRLEAARAIAERLARSAGDRGERVVYAPHADEQHPDHRAAARLARLAFRGSGVEVRFYEVWTPLRRMDEILDVTPAMERKLRAVRCYESQVGVLRFDEACEGLARYRGEMFCWPKPERDAGRYAEVFARMRR